MSFSRQLDALLHPVQPSSDPLVVKCDCCPQDAKSFYRSRPRNSLQEPEYHAFCEQHADPARLASHEECISLDQYVVGFVHES